jgi:hypothetical protein
MTSLPSAQLQLSPLPSLQPLISPENAVFDRDTYRQFFNSSVMLVKNRKLFIYNFRRKAAEDDAVENGDFERDVVEDGAFEGEVDGATVNYDIPSPPEDQHYDTLELRQISL